MAQPGSGTSSTRSLERILELMLEHSNHSDELGVGRLVKGEVAPDGVQLLLSVLEAKLHAVSQVDSELNSLPMKLCHLLLKLCPALGCRSARAGQSQCVVQGSVLVGEE